MIRVASLILSTALLLAGAADAQTLAPEPDTISFEETEPFGGYMIRWRVDATGQGHFVAITGRGPRSTKVEGRFTVSVAEFEGLSGLLRPLEGLKSCLPDIDDVEQAAVTWGRGEEVATTLLYGGCPNESDRQALARAREATAMVRRWAAAPASP